MKKNIFTLLVLGMILMIPGLLFSQSWDGPYKHKSVLCYRLSGANQPVILAVRTCETSFLSTNNILILKIKSPFANKSGFSRVKMTRFNPYDGEVWGTGDRALKCKNGWLYLKVKVWDNGTPYEDYLITVYEKNDYGVSSGRKKTIRTRLLNLDILDMPMNYNVQMTY